MRFPVFYRTRGFIAVCTSAGHLPDETSPCLPIPLLGRSILVLTCHLRLDLPSGLFPGGLLTRTLYALLRATRPEITFFLIWSPENYLVSRERNAPRVVFHYTLLPRPSSAHSSRTLSAYVPPSMWDSKLHTHTKEKTQFWVSQSLYFWIANSKRQLHWMMASIPWFQTWYLICQACSQISELFQLFQGFIIHLYIVFASCMLTSKRFIIYISIQATTNSGR